MAHIYGLTHKGVRNVLYWAIIETHNGEFNSVQGPYNSDMEAYDHIDKLRAHRAKYPLPLKIEWKATKVLHPSYVG
jgi:hypothetical protein